MADREVWNLGGPIAAPAATDRVPIATAPNAGGYSQRAEFAWRDANNIFRAFGTLGGAIAKPTEFRLDGSHANSATPTNQQLKLSLLYGSGTEAYGWALDNLGGIWQHAGNSVGGTGRHVWATGGVERMRLSEAGHLGVGVNPAVRLNVKSSSEIARFETTSAPGGGNGFISIFDSAARKGYWGYGGLSDVMYLMNDKASSLYLGVHSSIAWYIDNTRMAPFADNAYAFGGPSNRPTQLYAVTGTVNTSDEREKTWRGAPTDDELRAAKRIVAELGFYQWNDAVAEKGDDARLHFGARAQQVWAIMADEGLIDPIEEGVTPSSKYAFLCYDKWDERTEPEMEGWRASAVLGPGGEPVMVKCAEGEEPDEMRPTGEDVLTMDAGDRFGIRPDQLALFLVACIDERGRREKAAADIRIEALEAALAELKKAA